MPENNPAGINAFGGPFEREQPYGAIARTQALTRLAPTSQPTALGAPKRAQRRATQRRQPGAQQALRMAPAAPQGPTYQQLLMQFWAQLAAEPGSSPLVREYANSLQAS